MRALAIDSMKSSQDVTFEEVEFRPCRTKSEGSGNNWWMGAAEENSGTRTGNSEAVTLKGTNGKTGTTVQEKKD